MRSHEPNDLYYQRLEVGRDASREEIVGAYRRLAHGVHPDTHPEDPDATRRFREITEAYDVLANPARRAGYDRDQAPGAASPIRVVVRRAAKPTWSPDEGPRVVLGATRWAGGDAPLRAGPVRIERHGEDDSTAFRGCAEESLRGVFSDLLGSLWRR